MVEEVYTERQKDSQKATIRRSEEPPLKHETALSDEHMQQLVASRREAIRRAAQLSPALERDGREAGIDPAQAAKEPGKTVENNPDIVNGKTGFAARVQSEHKDRPVNTNAQAVAAKKSDHKNKHIPGKAILGPWTFAEHGRSSFRHKSKVETLGERQKSRRDYGGFVQMHNARQNQGNHAFGLN